MWRNRQRSATEEWITSRSSKGLIPTASLGICRREPQPPGARLYAERRVAPDDVGGTKHFARICQPDGMRQTMRMRRPLAEIPMLQREIAGARKRRRTAAIHEKLREKWKVHELKMCKSQKRAIVRSSLQGIVLTRDELHNWLLFRDLNRGTREFQYRPIGLFLEALRRLFSIPQAFPQAGADPPQASQTHAPAVLTPRVLQGFL